jgi:hypothetical protein
MASAIARALSISFAGPDSVIMRAGQLARFLTETDTPVRARIMFFSSRFIAA